jgi:hypothetical protein
LEAATKNALPVVTLAMHYSQTAVVLANAGDDEELVSLAHYC